MEITMSYNFPLSAFLFNIYLKSRRKVFRYFRCGWISLTLYLSKETMTIHLSHKMNHMNESVTIKVLSPSSKRKMPLYVKALMSSRSYSYEKIGNYLDRVRKRELQWLLTLKKNGPCFSGRATSKKRLDARHFCNRVQIQSPGLTSFCPLWLDNLLEWAAECMENRKDASQKQPQGETCNDA